MAKQMKKFGKNVNTNSVALALYEEQSKIYEAIAQLEEQKKKHLRTYLNMEGKYAIGTECDVMAGQGFRGYVYKYACPELRAREESERQNYYITHITPLDEQMKALRKQAWELEEPICIALWGFGQQHYHIYRKLQEAEAELKAAQERVDALRMKLMHCEG
jgi:uncharacterized protein YaaN involved in tellurite resistance